MLRFFTSNFIYYQYCIMIPTFYTNHLRIILCLYSHLTVTSIEVMALCRCTNNIMTKVRYFSSICCPFHGFHRVSISTCPSCSFNINEQEFFQCEILYKVGSCAMKTVSVSRYESLVFYCKLKNR